MLTKIVIGLCKAFLANLLFKTRHMASPDDKIANATTAHKIKGQSIAQIPDQIANATTSTQDQGMRQSIPQFPDQMPNATTVHKIKG